MGHVSERRIPVNRKNGDAEPDDGAKAHDKEFMATLAKGLAVLGTFNKERPTMTLSQAALAAGLSRGRRDAFCARSLSLVTSNRPDGSLRCLRASSNLALLISRRRIGSSRPRR